MSHYLVTGGAGFIGSHLAERLLGDNHHVHLVDDLSSNPIPFPQLLAELGHPKQLSYDIMPIRSYYSPERWDGIYHLASRVGPAGILQHAGEMVRSIVDDTYHVMQFAQRSNCRLIFVSTSEVFGGGAAGLCRENMPCIIPAEVTVRLEYAVAKLAAEVAVINTCKVTSLDSVLIRPFNVCGPRQSGKGGFVVPRFIAQALAGESLTIFGDGTQVRAFTDVRDIVSGLMLAMEKGKRGSIYNIGNPQGYTSIMGLAKTINRLCHNYTPSQFVDGRDVFGALWADAADKFPDATKAMGELSWQPSRGIEDTIRDVIAYEQKKVQA